MCLSLQEIGNECAENAEPLPEDLNKAHQVWTAAAAAAAADLVQEP